MLSATACKSLNVIGTRLIASQVMHVKNIELKYLSVIHEISLAKNQLEDVGELS